MVTVSAMYRVVLLRTRAQDLMLAHGLISCVKIFSVMQLIFSCFWLLLRIQLQASTKMKTVKYKRESDIGKWKNILY